MYAGHRILKNYVGWLFETDAGLQKQALNGYWLSPIFYMIPACRYIKIVLGLLFEHSNDNIIWEHIWEKGPIGN